MLEALEEPCRRRIMFNRMLRAALFVPLLALSFGLTSPLVLAQDSAWDGLITAGRTALQQNNFAEAEQLFEKALETAETFPPGDPRLGRSLNNLAAVYYKQEDYGRSEPLMRRSLAILEQSLGPESADVAQTKKNLAAIYYLQGNFEDAEPLLKESLSILEELHGPNHAFVATVLNNLAALYQAQDRYTDAEPLLTRSLGIWENLLGKDHQDVVKSRELLARLREANGIAPGAVAEGQQPALDPSTADQLVALASEAEAAILNNEDIDQATQALADLTASKQAAAPAVPDGPQFSVYLSTLWSEEEAMRYWRALKKEVPDVLADKEVEIVEIAATNGGGSFYRVLTTPFPSDPAAQQACDQIRSQVRTHDCNVIAR